MSINNNRKNIMVIGSGRAGKDTVAEMLAYRINMSYAASSLFCAQHFIYKALKEEFNYSTVMECYNARHIGDNRVLWFNMIREYNKDDPTRLAKAIYAEHDIYCGIRSKIELDACKAVGLVDVTIFVDGGDRVPLEGKGSMELTVGDADYVLNNGGHKDDLPYHLTRMIIDLDL